MFSRRVSHRQNRGRISAGASVASAPVGPSIVDIGVAPVLYLDADAITGLADGADMTEAAMNAAQLQDTTYTFTQGSLAWPSYQATAFGSVSKPCIRFTAASSEQLVSTAAALLAVANGEDTPFTVVAEIQMLSGGAFVIVSWDSGGTTNRCSLFLNTNAWACNRRASTNKLVAGATVGTVTAQHVISLLADNAAAHTADIREDGTLVVTGGDINTESVASTSFRIGARKISASHDLLADMRLRRLAIYSQELTSTQEGNLRSGWAALDA